MNEELQKELTWASIALVAFIAVLLFAGISEIYEILIQIRSCLRLAIFRDFQYPSSM